MEKKNMTPNDVTKAITEEIRLMMDKSTGLYLLELPTGSSKSYSTFQAICDYVLKNNTSGGRTILFLTPQKKNLKMDTTMFDCYLTAYRKLHPSVSKEEIEKKFHEDFFLLNNKFFYLDKLIRSDLRIPSEIKQGEAYRNIVNALKQRETGIVSQEGWSSLFYGIESKFKDAIIDYLCKKLSMPSDESCVQFLLKHLLVVKGRFPWVGELYPGTFIQYKRVIFMSFDKFLYGNSSILPHMGNFLSLFTKKLGDSLIPPILFIDEVDSTHDCYEKWILQDALSHRGDLINLFTRIHHGLQEHKSWSETLQKISDEDGKIDALLHAASEIMEKYQLSYDIKYNGDDRASLFGMSSSFYFTVGEKFSYMEFDKENNKSLIHVVNYSDYQKYLAHHPVEDRLFPARMLLEIRYFFNRLYQVIRNFWADAYADEINKEIRLEREEAKKLGEKPKERNHFDLTESISTIYDRLGINHEIFQKYKNILCPFPFSPSFQRKRKNRKENPFSFSVDILDRELHGGYFQSGYSMLDLLNYWHSNERTLLRYFTKNMTAESSLLHLADSAMVIGISATANVIHYRNYFLPVLTNTLKDTFYSMSSKFRQDIQNYYCAMHHSYLSHHIQIEPQCLSMPNFSGFDDIRSFFSSIYGNSNLAIDVSELIYQNAEQAAHKNSFGNDPWYYVRRYANIAEAMAQFYASPSAHAWLFLNTPLLKEHNPGFSLDVIQKMKDVFDSKYLHKRKVQIHILSSGDEKNDFRAQKAVIEDDLNHGTDVLVFSSYASICTGIDLDYESKCHKDDYEDIFSEYKSKTSDSRHKRRDFDGFVLGEITHILPLINNTDNSTEIDELTRHEILSLILALANIDELHFNDGRKYIYHLLKDDNVMLLKKFLGHFFSECRSFPFIAGYCKFILMQALGRGNRAFNKNHHIQIFCHEKNLQYLSCAPEDDTDISIRTPEWQALMSLVCAPQPEPEEFEKNRIFNSNRRATEASYNLLSYLLGFNFRSDIKWTDSKQKTYDLLGDFTIRFPTFDSIESVIQSMHYSSDEAELIRKFGQVYCHFVDEPQNAYRYLEDTSSQPYLFRSSESKDEALRRYKLNPNSLRRCDSVSFVRTSLPFLFDKLPELKEYMEKQGYATSFPVAYHVLNPLLFINFYLGRLGEIVGSWILSYATHGQLQLHDLDLQHYELFDRQLPSGDPIDFKHWRFSTCCYADKDALIRKMKGKLNLMQEDNPAIRHAYLIRLCETPEENAFCHFSDSGESAAPYYEDVDQQIIQIPYLVNQDGINLAAIHKILEYELARDAIKEEK